MKSVLVVALLLVLMVLGAYFLLRGNPEGAPVPGTGSAAISGSSGPPATELSMEAASPRVDGAPPKAVALDRLPAADSHATEPRLLDDLASDSGGEHVISAEPASIEEIHAAWEETFTTRYAGVSAADRQAAIEAIKRVLYGSEAGDGAKGAVLTDDQVRDLKREIEWLSLHEIP
jgi:hypothetical protein